MKNISGLRKNIGVENSRNLILFVKYLMETKILDGANMDIDLTSQDQTSRKQSKCPRNEAEGNNIHKCAVKNVSICDYFCGIQYLDKVICCYPNKNTSIDKK